MKKVMLIFGCLLLLGCNEKKGETSEDFLGEFVYLDQYKCVHVKQKCIKLMFSDEGEKPNYMVRRLPVSKLKYFGRTCSVCISDEIFKELQEIVEKNNNCDYDSIIYE